MPRIFEGIDRSADRMDGAPCIAGTYLPVADLLGFLADMIDAGKTNPIECALVTDESLTRKGVVNALRFAAAATGIRDEVTDLRRRVQAAESAARTKIEDVRRAGLSLGRELAQWGDAYFERRANALEAILDRARAVHAESCSGAGCAMCAVLSEHVETMSEAMQRQAREREGRG